ncbi:MAG: hypothetical protein HUK16_01455, partial [Bacteroidales bacterium]|nr:hypothetical protein [Bacteroidales bacterium]
MLAKKSHNLINIITWISIIGISVASLALIVVLSAFNGLEEVISSLNHRLTPDLQIAPIKGKTIDLSAFPMEQVGAVEGVDYVVPTITEDALFRANEKQHIGQVKGVGKAYEQIERIREVVFEQGEMSLSDADYDYAVPGAGVAWYLGINAYDPYSVLRIYVPKRGNASSMSLENSFNSGVLTVQSVFATEQEMDEKMV